jgi:hypothetical protein
MHVVRLVKYNIFKNYIKLIKKIITNKYYCKYASKKNKDIYEKIANRLCIYKS